MRPPSFWTAIKRGFTSACPACGKSRLFYRFLKVVPVCEQCHTPLEHYPADDAPPYLTLFIVLHIVVPLTVMLDREFDPPTLHIVMIGLLLTTLLTMLLIQPVKGLVLAILWRLKNADT